MSLPGSRSIAVLSALIVTACVRHLPPAPTPEARAPAVQGAAPSQAGHGRLIVDVVDGPTPVQLVRMVAKPVGGGPADRGVRLVEAPELLCEGTPCVVDPVEGNMLLGFPVIGDATMLETDLVHIGPEPTVYRRALSQYHHTKKTGLYKLGIILAAVGGTAALTGAILLPIGLKEESDGLATAGAITLGAGLVVLGAGYWALRIEADTYRPGAAIHFALEH